MCESSTAGVASVISAVETFAGGLARALRLLEHGLEVLARHVERGARALRDPLVDRLAPGRPHRAGGGRVRVVVGQQIAAARLDRPRGLEAGERQPVKIQTPRGAVLVVASGGDLLVAHAVAEEEDDVLGLAAVEGGAGVACLVGLAADRELRPRAEHDDRAEAAEENGELLGVEHAAQAAPSRSRACELPVTSQRVLAQAVL